MESWTDTADASSTTADLLSVLVIEDDRDTADLYATRLALDGYRALVAGDGERGIALARTVAPDLIYLDLRLPSLDGFQVLQRLRADPSTAHIPVVILTDYSQPELRRCGLQLGALEFLIKTETAPSRLSKATRTWAPLVPRPRPRDGQLRGP